STATSTPTVREAATPSIAPPIDPRIAVAATLGYASDDLNFGVGVRGGKTLENRFHVGGAFQYHFGHSVTATAGGATAQASYSAFYLGPEAGYDFDFEPVILRPYVGLG